MFPAGVAALRHSLHDVGPPLCLSVCLPLDLHLPAFLSDVSPDHHPDDGVFPAGVATLRHSRLHDVGPPLCLSVCLPLDLHLPAFLSDVSPDHHPDDGVFPAGLAALRHRLHDVGLRAGRAGERADLHRADPAGQDVAPVQPRHLLHHELTLLPPLPLLPPPSAPPRAPPQVQGHVVHGQRGKERRATADPGGGPPGVPGQEPKSLREETAVRGEGRRARGRLCRLHRHHFHRLPSLLPHPSEEREWRRRRRRRRR